MEQQHSTIKCPECGAEIDVNDVIYHQLEDQLKAKYEADLAEEKQKLHAECCRLEEEKKGIDRDKYKEEEEDYHNSILMVKTQAVYRDWIERIKEGADIDRSPFEQSR